MRPSQVSLSLRQKLSELSLSPLPPASPTSSTKGKRRSVFPSSWKRDPDGHSNGMTSLNRETFEREKLQEVMSRLIFQAGVDFETRPMVIIAACALPNPDEVSYDLLLARILSYLDLYVESDYTLVFLAAGGRHTPAWNWVWKAYRSQLSRKYRKHLKKLYVVHPSFFSKMLFSLAGAIISPKFFRKIQYLTTLSDLAHHVPLTQIDIPPAVYRENLKYEARISLPVHPLSSHFGIPLDELMGAYGEKGDVPRVVRDCVTFIRQSGMEELGLFRRSPSSQLLIQAQEAYDRGHPVSLETYGDPHIAAVLLKKFFRDLPTPIFPEESYSIIRRCPPPSQQDGDQECILYIREYILPGLGSYSAVILLSYVLHLLHDISLRANVNKMDARNLAIVFAPNLVKSSNPMRDVQQCIIPGSELDTEMAHDVVKEDKSTVGMVLKCCIHRYFEVFDDVPDRSEAVPPSLSGSGEVTARPGIGGYSRKSLDDRPASDDDLDDSMLVVPSGLDSQPDPTFSADSRPPPSAWVSQSSALPYQPRLSRHTRIASGAGTSNHGPAGYLSSKSPSRGLGVSSVATGGIPEPFPSISRSRSMISIDKGPGPMAPASTKKGSIRLVSGTLKGTVGKSAGAAVEALGITASGFFSPPDGDTANGPDVSSGHGE